MRMYGAWYRFDVPYIIQNLLNKQLNPDEFDLDYALYTDTDVLFFKDFNECSLPKPKVLYMGPETVQGLQANSGVLYMNVSAMAEHWPTVLNYAISKNFTFDAYDQGLFQQYFRDQNISQLLPDIFNWKGYWGQNENAVIVHFHGPKPGKCLECLLEFRVHSTKYCDESRCPYQYVSLYNRKVQDNGEFYERMLHAFRHYASQHS